MLLFCDWNVCQSVQNAFITTSPCINLSYSTLYLVSQGFLIPGSVYLQIIQISGVRSVDQVPGVRNPTLSNQFVGLGHFTCLTLKKKIKIFKKGYSLF